VSSDQLAKVKTASEISIRSWYLVYMSHIVKAYRMISW
jgi:hypothetical protein